MKLHNSYWGMRVSTDDDTTEKSEQVSAESKKKVEGIKMGGDEEGKTEGLQLRDLPWSVLASATGLILLGYAYSSGDAYYTSFLAEFWVGAEAFPIDKARHLVLAVWNAWNAVNGVQKWADEHWLILFKLLGGMLLYILACMIAGKLLLQFFSFIRNRVRSVPPRVKKLQPAAKRYVSYVALVMFFTLGAAIFDMAITTIIILPSGIGVTVGKNVARDLKRDLDRGCSKSHARCQILVKDGKELARGYVIVQSATRVALYYDGNTREIPMDGVELRTADRAPSH
ncbi:hypothetical protein [Burkholderia gladioli]|uniref:hypothetical protein n=1 Tax=Burkholderia gladioli TaxID=28095 RepID=UPI002FDFA0FD